MEDRHREAWTSQEPPADFAEQVVRTAMRERQRRVETKRYRRIGLVCAAALAAAMILVSVVQLQGRPSTGDYAASARSEVAIDGRAVAVLEAGAHVRWQGERVTQSSGDVFYRVSSGGAFRVETPTGFVEVKGTCFRVRVGGTVKKDDEAMRGKKEVALIAAGAVLGGVTVVTVYEGRVLAASHAGAPVTLAAGESASMDTRGARRLGSNAERAEAERALQDGTDRVYAEANSSLAKEIAGLNRRLRSLKDEKVTLEKRLETANAQLTAADGPAPARSRDEFDLSEEDWAELAKEGTMKYRTPCLRDTPWQPDNEDLARLGLAPEDGPAITEAYARSNKRVSDAILPGCAKLLGENADVAAMIGPDICTHLLVNEYQRRDPEGLAQAKRELMEIRSGKKPAPGPNEAIHPFLSGMLVLTGEMKAFEADLAKTFGPEEAHRIAFAEGICAQQSTWQGKM